MMNWDHARRHLGVVVLMALVAGTVPVLPQSRILPDAPGTWKPWIPFAATGGSREQQSATLAQLKAFEGVLLTLRAIVRRASGVEVPVGFSVETWGSLASAYMHAHAPGQPVPSALPLAGTFTFAAFHIFEYERNGKFIREDTGETAQQQFLINQIGRGVIDSGFVTDWGSVDHDAFLQPLPQGEIAGLPLYGDGLVIARDPAGLWTPLTQRAALDLVTAARQLEISSLQESAAAYTARLAVVRDPAWRAKRMKEAQEAVASMPNGQAFLKQIEESIGIEEGALLKELDPAAGGKGLVEARRALAAVTEWIAELTPAEQAEQACYAVTGTTLRARFRTVPSPACHPLVRPNYGYFNRALPRSAPQVLIITPIRRCFNTADKLSEANSATPGGCRANRDLVETLDKDALRAWLR